MGDVQIGTMRHRDVLYVEKANINLISLNKMFKDGWEAQFSTNKATLKRDNESIEFALKNGLYTLNDEKVFITTESSADTHRWHSRFAHLSTKMITYMSNNGIVEGLDLKSSTTTNACTPCNLANLRRNSFKKVQHEINALDIIHSDICGPFEPTLGGKKYFLSLIDEKTRFKWVFLIKTRDETYEILRNFISYTET